MATRYTVGGSGTSCTVGTLISGGGGKWERRGTSAPGGTESGRHLEGRKYGILKFDRFWQIGICIADSDFYLLISPNTPPVLGPHFQLLVLHNSTQSNVCTKKLTLLT